MSTDTIRTWTRPDLEQAVAGDVPEGQAENSIYVRVSPLLLLNLMDWVGQKGTPVEIVSAHGDTTHVELHFFRRDV